jgi:hypothetical protein
MDGKASLLTRVELDGNEFAVVYGLFTHGEDLQKIKIRHIRIEGSDSGGGVMAPIIAEFSYWSYGAFARSAMVPRPEVNASDVEKIARRYAVKVEVRPSSSLFFTMGRAPGRYRKMVLKVEGDGINEIRGFIREIILTYGRPDEVPLAFSTSRRAGKAIVESLLREYPGR